MRLILGRKKSCSYRQNGPRPRQRYQSEDSSGTFSSSELSVDFESSVSHQLHFELQQVLDAMENWCLMSYVLKIFIENAHKNKLFLFPSSTPSVRHQKFIL